MEFVNNKSAKTGHSSVKNIEGDNRQICETFSRFSTYFQSGLRSTYQVNSQSQKAWNSSCRIVRHSAVNSSKVKKNLEQIKTITCLKTTPKIAIKRACQKSDEVSEVDLINPKLKLISQCKPSNNNCANKLIQNLKSLVDRLVPIIFSEGNILDLSTLSQFCSIFEEVRRDCRKQGTFDIKLINANSMNDQENKKIDSHNTLYHTVMWCIILQASIDILSENDTKFTINRLLKESWNYIENLRKMLHPHVRNNRKFSKRQVKDLNENQSNMNTLLKYKGGCITPISEENSQIESSSASVSEKNNNIQTRVTNVEKKRHRELISTSKQRRSKDRRNCRELRLENTKYGPAAGDYRDTLLIRASEANTQIGHGIETSYCHKVRGVDINQINKGTVETVNDKIASQCMNIQSPILVDIDYPANIRDNLEHEDIYTLTCVNKSVQAGRAEIEVENNLLRSSSPDRREVDYKNILEIYKVARQELSVQAGRYIKVFKKCQSIQMHLQNLGNESISLNTGIDFGKEDRNVDNSPIFGNEFRLNFSYATQSYFRAEELLPCPIKNCYRSAALNIIEELRNSLVLVRNPSVCLISLSMPLLSLIDIQWFLEQCRRCDSEKDWTHKTKHERTRTGLLRALPFKCKGTQRYTRNENVQGSEYAYIDNDLI